MDNSLVNWASDKLSFFLQMQFSLDMVKHVIAINNAEDLTDYLTGLIDEPNNEYEKFISEFVNRRFSDEFSNAESSDISSKKTQHLFTDKNTNENEIKGEVIPKHKGHRKKFVPLFSEDGQFQVSVKLPGRNLCECQASKHELINNCLKCGRVVCAQEGAGPCFFCDSMVYTKDGKRCSAPIPEQEVIIDETDSRSKSYMKAVEYKNRLLDYDRTSAKRTEVIDDQCDYYATGSAWLDKQQRKALKHREEEIHAARYASRRNQPIKLNILGGDSFLDEVAWEVDDSKFLTDLIKKQTKEEKSEAPLISNDTLFNKTLSPFDQGLADKLKSKDVSELVSSNLARICRIQDDGLQSLNDTGKCLSMHQPYASLLVHGIKKHEGRTWYTSHRGPLWIAATAKVPTADDIKLVEMFYRQFHDEGNIKFPTIYPTASLLGRVTVVDCVPSEQYKEDYANHDESNSPYVFICQNPCVLRFKFPIKGKHKIYQLDSTLLSIAKHGLKNC